MRPALSQHSLTHTLTRTRIHTHTQTARHVDILMQLVWAALRANFIVAASFGIYIIHICLQSLLPLHPTVQSLTLHPLIHTHTQPSPYTIVISSLGTHCEGGGTSPRGELQLFRSPNL